MPGQGSISDLSVSDRTRLTPSPVVAPMCRVCRRCLTVHVGVLCVQECQREPTSASGDVLFLWNGPPDDSGPPEELFQAVESWSAGEPEETGIRVSVYTRLCYWRKGPPDRTRLLTLLMSHE
uniref:(California timema) hypothetical protein n=1 Tax=Timema californicum TaxID=61474 RepID=A0A7R9PD77_TIMCA|nr:unnamed protein product [Timema californicum]